MRKIKLLLPLLALFSLFTFNAFGADITCSAGEYLPKDKDEACAECLEGYYCEGGGFNKGQGKDQGLTQCPTTAPYSNPGAKSDKDCYAKTTTIDCEGGYYLPKGDEKCSICPSGSYCIGIKGVTVDKTKDQGIEKCPSTAPYSKSGAPDEKSCFDTPTCKSGEFLPKNAYEKCETCRAGSYCKGGKYPYSETNDQGIEKCPTTSPFSEEGSDDSSDCKANLVCLAGTFLLSGGQTCSTCYAGSWCGGGTFTNNTSTQGMTKCDAATPFSPDGATSSTQCSATINCGAGEFLPKGGIQCKDCQEGYFCDGTKSPYSYDDKNDQGLAQCPTTAPYSNPGAKGEDYCYGKAPDITCSAGEFLSKDNKCETCWANYYCEGGGFYKGQGKDQGLTQCPDDKPYSDTGAKSESDCYAKTTTIDCEGGYYLPKGDEKCSICPSGSYCAGLKNVSIDNTKDQGIEKCPTTAPYSKSGAVNTTECFDTPTCKSGEFLPTNAYEKCETCRAGSYCKGGKYPFSETNDQGIEQCDKSAPFSESGSDDSSDCKANLVCLAGTFLLSGGQTCSTCYAGSWCGGGTFTNNTSTQGITKCDTSTPFSPAGATSSTQCSATINCSAGAFLPAEKIDCESCWEGYYCDGTKSPYSYDNKNNQGLTQCPDDKPYSDKGAKSESDCYAKTNNITCSAGEFLSKDNKCETCWANYYCKGGMWTPDDKEHGLTQCPDDKPYSDKGAKGEGDCYGKTTTIDCDVGYYLPMGDEKCSICPSGSYCVGIKGVSVDTTKDQGIEKCPTTAPYSASGTPDEKSCFDTPTCKSGEFLPKNAYEKCETCRAGSYCKGGKYPYSETGDQGIEQCDKSAPFSESGSDDNGDCKANLVCLAGTYLVGGTFVCSTCPSGNYCVGGTFTNNTTTQGFTKCDTSTPFSPAGATSSTQCSATIDCAEGELLKAGGTQCDPCWEGYFCSGAKGLSFNDKEDQGLSECSKVDSNNPLSDLGAKSADDCYAAKCEAGEYLPEKSTKCQSCPKAQSCNGGNFKYSAKGSQGFTYSCDAGYYLPADSEDCALCPSDYYCPGVTDVEFDENNAQGLYPCPTSTPYSLPGTASSGECSTTMYIICPAGQYLPKNATSCIGCPANYYCPGGIYPYNTSDDQGKIACNAKYPNSDAGSSFLQQCYLTIATESCAKINKVSNGTPTYATPTSSVPYGNYSNAGNETDDIGACEITSLSCDTGYIKEPSSNGPLANYVNQAHSISKSSTLYRAASGNSGANSGAANGFGDSTGMTNGTAVIAWKDGTEIYLNANCNATAGSTAGEVSKSAPSGSGNYCWCQMTGYNLGNGSTSVSDANSVYVPIRSPATCTDNCAEQCVSYFMSNTTVRTSIIGTYGEQMACIEPTYSCDPGYYFPANSTTCTLCEAGYYCPGFTDVSASNIPANKPYGRKSCPTDHPSSDAGTTDVAFCYYDNRVDCSRLVKILNTTSVSYANSPVTQRNYTGGGSVVTPFGGCAVTGATCSNAGEVLVGTDGPLANYESPLYGMPSSTSNHNIYYRAIDGSSANSSGANGNYGDSTGMTNGTFRLVYWNELDITGTASCAVNANGKYDCNCDLTSYKIGSGNTVSVNPAERLFSKTSFVDSLSSCEKKCAYGCAMQLASAPEFGSLGMNKSCGVPGQTYTCAPGTYLPANATVCATCTQNHWCGGGTWEQVSFAQGLEDCPNEFPYSDAGSRDVAFCYKEPSTLQCSAVNPVRGANVTYANSTAATRIYDPGTVAQTESIGACAISSFTCNAGYTATNNWSDGPLVNYINASRNLDLSATKLKSNDGSTKSGTGEFFGGDATSLNKGTFELVYSNGTKIQGRSSCNSTSGDLFELKTNGTFDTLSAGEECWCNMTGYQLNGSSAVNVSDTNWVYWGAFGDTNSCMTTCTKRCIQVLFQPENTNGEYENALFGAYGKNSVPPCNPNSYSITWYNGNNNLETNQCYYDEHLTIPSSATARTGYKIKWQIRTGN